MSEKFDLSEDQKKALTKLSDWFHSKQRKSYFSLGGYAGTGKTTVISIWRKQLVAEKTAQKSGNSDSKVKKFRVAFCSYTGKATRVLKNKLVQQKAVIPGDFVGTIHSLIYSPRLDSQSRIVGWEKKPTLESDLIVVDEASMLDSKIWQDLLSFQLPILAVGDHGQLPPINDKFQLLTKLDFALEKIHRQAERNPLIQLSREVRETGTLPFGNFGPGIRKLDRTDPETQEITGEILASYNPELLVLCGFNYTRIKLNNFIRQSKDIYAPLPQTGERVICLRNNHAKQIFNGMLGTISSVAPFAQGTNPKLPIANFQDWLELGVNFDGEDKTYQGIAYIPQFNEQKHSSYQAERSLTLAGDLFDFGYALTVHKAQGSEAEKVLLFEERSQYMDDETWRRWLYTAITRAKSELIVVG